MINWRTFFQQRQNWLAIILVLVFAFVALAAPVLAPPDDPENPLPFKITDQKFSRLPYAPTQESLLGTIPQITSLPQFGIAPGQDAHYQWDVLYTLIWGTRSAFRFGLVVSVTAAVLGVLVGAVGAYFGGRVDRLLLFATDSFLAFPVIAVAWLIQRTWFANIYNPYLDPTTLNGFETVLYDLKLNPIMIALILFSWMPYARLVNTTVAQLRTAEFVTAARALGASEFRIIFRHLLPNAISPAVVYLARDIGGVVVIASALTFIGFGGDIAWAIMLVSAREFVLGLSGNPFVYWWTFIPVALALTIFALAWNLLGDGLNVALNPRKSK
ncbi:MAG: ABC transporter permease [Candidatus Promineifilaceae bacterium]